MENMLVGQLVTSNGSMCFVIRALGLEHAVACTLPTQWLQLLRPWAWVSLIGTLKKPFQPLSWEEKEREGKRRKEWGVQFFTLQIGREQIYKKWIEGFSLFAFIHLHLPLGIKTREQDECASFSLLPSPPSHSPPLPHLGVLTAERISENFLWFVCSWLMPLRSQAPTYANELAYLGYFPWKLVTATWAHIKRW